MEEHYRDDWASKERLYEVFRELREYVSQKLINGRIDHYFIEDLNILNLKADSYGKTAKDLGVFLKNLKVENRELDPFFDCMNDDSNNKTFFNFKFEKCLLQCQNCENKLPEIFLRVVISSCIKDKFTAKEEISVHI